MSDTPNTTKRSGALLYILTPFLLLLLTGGILILCYFLAPAHQLQKYLNIVFMDNLKTTTKTAGLNIIEHDFNSDSVPEQTFETGVISYPVFGEQYAMLEIESIGLNVGVFYGVNPELLERGACHSTQSAVIGEIGNAVIDAHVNTFFSELSEVQPGDKVVVYTSYGRFVYEVSEQIEFSKTDKRYVAVTRDAEYLTLYTCKPQVLGSSDQRIGIRCVPVEKQFFQQAEGGSQ